jgi:hypothetical protein
MATPAATPGTFPQNLDAVPRNEQVVECFGWLYAFFGTMFFSLSVVALLNGGWTDVRDLATRLFIVGMAPAGAAMIWWEFRRRARRTALVPRSGAIGVYRGGKFSHTITLDQLKIWRLSSGRRLRVFVLWPIIVVTFLVLGALSHSWALIIVDALIIVGSIPGARSLLKLEHCVVPGPARPQDILIEKADITRLAGG